MATKKRIRSTKKRKSKKKNSSKKRFKRIRKVYVRLIDTPTRSIVKSIVWRTIGIIILGIISWYYTKDIQKATIVTVLFHVIRFFLYYVHERIWERVRWGQEEEKL